MVSWSARWGSRGTRTALAVGIALAAVGLPHASGPVAAATTFTVTSTSDAGDLNLADTVCDAAAAAGSQCTLRAAIQEANDTAGPDTIRFVITTGASAIKVISPGSPLPQITDAVTINGYTQAGASVNTLATGNDAVLRIVLNGIDAGTGTNGLVITASNSTVRGLVIQRFDGHGILLTGSGNAIRGNFIGTTAAGTAARGNDYGVFIEGGDDNVVGGTTAAARNVVSGNDGSGVFIHGNDATENVVQGNFIGTTRAGDAPLGNVVDGVRLGEAAAFTLIRGNVLSSNGYNGVAIFSNSPDNVVAGNLIGTDVTGLQDLGNLRNGIRVAGFSPRQLIGGLDAADRNIIAGNAGYGIDMSSDQITVQGNYIGVDATGNAPLGNDDTGLFASFGSSLQIGGTAAGARNVISANGGHGVLIGGDDNVMEGNRVGTKADGTGDLGNLDDGIVFVAASNNTVGGTVGAAANLISGNGAVGTHIRGSSSTGNEIIGNVIRLNDGEGVRLQRGPNTVSGNVIFQNGSDGVQVPNNSPFAASTGGTIVGNQIFGNAGLGIDLVGGSENAAGVTSNDTDDPDSGANDLQNFPVLTSATRASNGVTTVIGILNSTPNTQFRIDLYVAVADPSSHGEGQFLVATQNITTNSGGDRGFTFASAQLVAGHVLTATATRISDGSTSEFSANRTVVAGP